MGASPFEVVCRSNRNSPLDLVHIPTINHFSSDAEARTNEIKKMHDEVQTRIEKNNQM